ncbi:ABC transporter ATP-binding protein [Streptomyces sp. NRRL S-813]|uniref:ABC transporter ATP-binding protein n=1 Tax=Streptomyces sp. NRRL S-813 TaxID=1463919 RepID=UPI0004BEDF52|nr:ATP-binding cassette domain-containing protein [Streptomyces sp. NRRL S-813]
MIRFDSVTKNYPDGTVAVNSLTLEAASGEITVLVGPSGCGKTTSLRMVNRMVEPTSGRVWLNDRDTAAIPPHELRRGIGYVIQQAGLFPHKTVLDNIATVPVLTGRTRRQARARAAELLELVGLDANLADRYPSQLSGGQQQRVGVARALAADPPVMLMDEPFSALDPVIRDQLQNEFLRLQHDLGKTVIFVTHDIDEAIKLGDKVAVLAAGGTLAQVGAPADLLSRPKSPFVASFLGRDRGYRALAFADAGSLPLTSEKTVHLGDRLALARERATDGWVLVLDHHDAPQGWLAASALTSRQATGTVTAELLNLGGTLATAHGTLRQALDAALSSPSGRGVIVHDNGQLAGTITAAEVLTRIETRVSHWRAAELQPAPATGTDGPKERP